MRNAVREVRTWIRVLKGMSRVEARQTPWRRARPDLWVRGFYSYTGEIYPSVKRRAASYVSDWDYERFLGSMNPARTLELFRDKLAFEKFLAGLDVTVRRPIHYGEILGGQLQLWVAPKTIVEGGAVAKPRFGKLGRGVTVISSVEDLLSLSVEGGDWVIQEKVLQHEYSRRIYPGSLNTVRVQAIRSQPSGRVVLLGAAHRFGAPATGVVDNVSAGGFVSSVDLRTGELGKLVSYSRNTGLMSLERHPSSTALVGGVVVPRWREVEGFIRMLMDAVPDALNVGFDLAMSEEGPVLIEANGNPSPRLLQYHGPFLDRDPAIRAFFAEQRRVRGKRRG